MSGGYERETEDKIMCNIPLMEIPLKILEKYSTNEYCKKHGCFFPVLCNQKMNAYLKELADICGIKKTLTTHVGVIFLPHLLWPMVSR